MDELKGRALAAADTIILDHGWPWNLNPDGEVETATEKSRLMLARGFLAGYSHGVSVMGVVADEAMSRIIADIKNTG